MLFAAELFSHGLQKGPEIRTGLMRDGQDVRDMTNVGMYELTRPIDPDQGWPRIHRLDG
jgi:hypothetical protein